MLQKNVWKLKIIFVCVKLLKFWESLFYCNISHFSVVLWLVGLGLVSSSIGHSRNGRSVIVTSTDSNHIFSGWKGHPGPNGTKVELGVCKGGGANWAKNGALYILVYTAIIHIT
jgi:hypothetical protein